MPLSRSPRTDRRRRTIRENLSIVSDGSDEARVSPTRTARNAELPELTKKERGVAYSHSVRGTCQQRVVQFIPVRKVSLAGVVAASAALPLLLIILHYCVFVNGALDWSGHPMSALLNANSPRSLAAWMCSHLWLLCLGATVLTFRLRRHKLDDYDGEYRLWFWLVFTCLIGSIDSTTRLTELFGAALDRWSQLHVGWSGVAIVSATLATLIGMLGLRLCSELKSVPTSLVLWLVGLVCWAGSAALSQSMFHLEMSTATRYWLRASLWLTGLTCIWLCSLYYLRATFMEAQKRFLSRAMASAQTVPWRERLRESMPKMPKMPKFGWSRTADDEAVEEEQATTKRKKRTRPAADSADEDQQDSQRQDSQRQDGRQDSQRQDSQRPNDRRDTARPVMGNAQPGTANNGSSNKTNSREERESREDREQTAAKKRGWSFGLGKLALRPPAAGVGDAAGSAEEAEVDREYGKKSGWFGRRKDATAKEEATVRDGSARGKPQRSDDDAQQDGAPKRSLRDRFSWKRRELTEEEQAKREAKQAARQKAREDKGKKQQPQDAADGEGAAVKRSWMRMPRPKLPKMSLPKPKFPKLKLPSFRLPPPSDASGASGGSSSNRNQVPNVDPSRPLPSTSSNRPNAVDQDNDDNRNLSKAERKRLKRMQREDEGDRRAA